MIKTATTIEGVNAINFGNTADRYYWCKNIGETTLYVSAKEDISPDTDDVAMLESGDIVMIETYNQDIYVLGAGKIQIYESETNDCPFKVSGKRGEAPDLSTYAKKTDIRNENLLINPDFKINQRGVSGTFSETGKYFVDRWRLVSGAITINADGTLMLNGTISQIFENAVGNNVAASVSAGTATYDNSTKTFSITANGEIISWAKLEYGSNATQFFPPDTATELPKCMRYYEILIPSGADRAVTGFLEIGKNATFDMKFSVPKRCAPSLTNHAARIIVNTFGSYVAILNNYPISQVESDAYGMVIASTDPVVSSDPSGYIGVSMDEAGGADLAVDAEIY